MLENLRWDWPSACAAGCVLFLALWLLSLVRALLRWLTPGTPPAAAPPEPGLTTAEALAYLRAPRNVPGTDEWVRYECRLVPCEAPTAQGPAPVIAPGRGGR